MAKNGDEMRVDEELEESGSEVRVYELGFHLDPELPTEEAKKAYKVLRDTISEKGTIVAEGEPEKIPLAYTISRQETAGRRDFDSAYFCWIAYETLVASHAEIIALASGDKRVIRFIDLITTKDAARHSVEMYELSLKAPQPVEESETTSGAELDAALENVVI